MHWGSLWSMRLGNYFGLNPAFSDSLEHAKGEIDSLHDLRPDGSKYLAGELHALSSSERNIGDKKLTPTCTLWSNNGILRFIHCQMLLLIAVFEVALSVSAWGPIQSRLRDDSGIMHSHNTNTEHSFTAASHNDRHSPQAPIRLSSVGMELIVQFVMTAVPE